LGIDVPAGTQTTPPPVMVHIFHETPTIGLAPEATEPLTELDIGMVDPIEPMDPIPELLELMSGLLELMLELMLLEDVLEALELELAEALGHISEPALAAQ